jgi:hypothetical protein
LTVIGIPACVAWRSRRHLQSSNICLQFFKLLGVVRMIHPNEYHLAKIILSAPEKYDATQIETRALQELVEAYEKKLPLETENQAICSHIMGAIATSDAP